MSSLGTLAVHLTAHTTQFMKRMEKAQYRMNRFGRNASKLGKTMTAGITLPLVAVGASAVREFANFNQAMTKSTSIMKGLTDQQRSAMKKQAVALSKDGAQSASELAESYYFLASAGMDAKQSMAALPIVQNFATAGAFDMATATDLLTDAQSAMGLSSDDVGENMKNLTHVSDVLTEAQNMANASTQEFSEALTNKAATSAAALGIPMEDVVSVLAVFADKGVKGSTAGEQYAIMLTNMTSKALSNEKAFKKFGVSVYDGEGKVRSMSLIMKDMEGALGGLSEKNKVAALAQMGFGDKARKSMMSLLGSSDALVNYRKELGNVAGVTKKIAKKQLTSFSNRWKMVKNRLVAVGLAIGEKLMPALMSVGEAIGWLAELFGSMPSFIQGAVLVIGALVAAIGPALLVMGSLATGLSSLAATTSMGGGFLAMLGPIAVVALAVSALTGAINEAMDLSDALDAEAETQRIAKTDTGQKNLIFYWKKRERQGKITNAEKADLSAALDRMKESAQGRKWLDKNEAYLSGKKQRRAKQEALAEKMTADAAKKAAAEKILADRRAAEVAEETAKKSAESAAKVARAQKKVVSAQKKAAEEILKINASAADKVASARDAHASAVGSLQGKYISNGKDVKGINKRTKGAIVDAGKGRDAKISAINAQSGLSPAERRALIQAEDQKYQIKVLGYKKLKYEAISNSKSATKAEKLAAQKALDAMVDKELKLLRDFENTKLQIKLQGIEKERLAKIAMVEAVERRAIESAKLVANAVATAVTNAISGADSSGKIKTNVGVNPADVSVQTGGVSAGVVSQISGADRSGVLAQLTKLVGLSTDSVGLQKKMSSTLERISENPIVQYTI